jgi:hypothetical protein
MTWQAKNWDRLMDALEEEECITWDGLDDALVGISVGIEPVAVYDWKSMVDVCMNRDAMTYETAVEHLQFNTLGGYLGPKTPIVVDLDLTRPQSKS